jgi:two-component system, LytTR family, sensor kinase
VLTREQTNTDALTGEWTGESRREPVLIHPVVFVAAFTLLGSLFALQEWINVHRAGYTIRPAIVFESWGLQYFLWGVTCWVLWRLFRAFIQKASVVQMFTIVLPLSLALCMLEEMLWVVFFPQVPLNHPRMTYWHRVMFNYKDDLAESMAIFWGTFFFFRGAGYYQQYREKETVAAQLEAQLANARIAALRMQLNPHFLFNTMNSISSLMRSDLDAADAMLEQLSSLLRMTLERGEVQLIPLHDEIEFTETYLAMQDWRYAGRVTRTLSIDPDLHDALVPAMILQPIVENAYTHGLSKLDRDGHLSIEICKEGPQLKAQITNSGLGLRAGSQNGSNGHGVGLSNVRNRLHLHYGENCSFSMREIDRNQVRVSISFPLQLSTNSIESMTRFGV